MMKKNIMLSFLSPLPGGKIKEYEELAADYTLESGKQIKACQTNEAPIYSVHEFLAAKGEMLDALFTFATSKVQESFQMNKGGQCISYSNVGEFLLKECHGHGVDFSFQQMTAYDDKAVNPVDESRQQAAAMALAIKAYLGEKGNWKDAHIYVDITGGFRYANMIMMTVIRLLQYDGMQVEKIVYSDKRDNSGQVYDFQELNKLYSLTAGADAFVKYGRSQAIEEYFGYTYGGVDNNNHLSKELVDLLQAMHRFSDSISLCWTSTLLKDMQALRRALDAYAQQKHPAGEAAFAQMLDTIYREYDRILVKDIKTYVPKMLDVIDWCLQKGFMQQALTLSNEWLPIYIVRMNICYPVDKNFNKATNILHRYWEQEFIISYNPPARQKRQNEIKRIGSMMKSMSEGKNYSSNELKVLPLKFRNFLDVLNRMDLMRKSYGNEYDSKGLRTYLTTDRKIDEVLNMVYQNMHESYNKSYTTFISSYAYKTKILQQVLLMGKKGWQQFLDEEPDNMKQDEPMIPRNSWEAKEKQWRDMFAEHIVDSEVDVEDAVCLLHHHYNLQKLRHITNHANQDDGNACKNMEDIKNTLMAAMQDFYRVTRKVRGESL